VFSFTHIFKKFGINLGRAEDANAYKILDIQNGTIYLRRNVKFYETKFIKTKDIDIFNINKEIISDNIEDLNNVEFYQDLILEDLIDEFENNENVEKNNEINITEENIDNNNYNENTNSNKNEDIVNKQNNDEDDIISSSEYEPLNIRLNKIKENNNEEIKNNNYISGTESDIESNYNTSSDELVPLNIRKMKRKIVSSSNDEDNQNHKRIEKDPNIIGEANHAEIWNNLPEINSKEVFIPSNIQEALRSKFKTYWIIAINEELENYDAHKTATKINKSQIEKNRKLIKLIWIFSLKTDENNKVLKFKARLVAKGYTQKKNIDYFATYSPTLEYESLRYLIAYAARHHYDCYQLDIKGAYLNSKIVTDIYTEIPVSHPDYEDGYCWKLNKALYGLKQAGRLWYEEINNTLINKLGFNKTYADSNIYYKIINDNEKVIIGLYVDDMIIIGNISNIQNTIKEIKYVYTVSKSEEIDSILGIKITKTNVGEYTMDQSKYIINKLNEYDIKEEKNNPYSEITDSDLNKQKR